MRQGGPSMRAKSIPLGDGALYQGNGPAGVSVETMRVRMTLTWLIGWPSSVNLRWTCFAHEWSCSNETTFSEWRARTRVDSPEPDSTASLGLSSASRSSRAWRTSGGSAQEEITAATFLLRGA